MPSRFTDLEIDSTGFLKLPSGTTAQRPSSPSTGSARFNTDLGVVEYYDGNTWILLSQKNVDIARGGQRVIDTIVDEKKYRLHYFLDPGIYQFVCDDTVEYLTVAGGGGGGTDANNKGAGGGAGGLLQGQKSISGIKVVVVGDGGAGSTQDVTNGSIGDPTFIGTQYRDDLTFTSTEWIAESDWTIANGTATCNGANSGRFMYNNSAYQHVQNEYGAMAFRISDYTSGNLYLSFSTGSNTHGPFNAVGTYIVNGLVTGNNQIYFRSESFIGTLDQVAGRTQSSNELCIGAGGGGTQDTVGSDGGSGGGGGGGGISGGSAGGSGISGQGNAGGNNNGLNPFYGGGGGGAGQSGQTGGNTGHGDGGDGAGSFITGTHKFFAAGGGGANIGLGGKGGGGDSAGDSASAGNGAKNSGSGGAGSTNSSADIPNRGGNGGSGIVIFRQELDPQLYPGENLLPYSNDITQWTTTGGVTFTSTNELAPDGTLTATTLTDDNGAGYEVPYQNVSIEPSTETYIASIFVKKAQSQPNHYPAIELQFRGGNSNETSNIRFNHFNGTASDIYSTDTNISDFGVIDYNSEWWRIFVSAHSSDGSHDTVRFQYNTARGTDYTNFAGTNAATGSTTVWGAQLEKSTVLGSLNTTIGAPAPVKTETYKYINTPKYVEDGLWLNLDASDIRSYPGTGNTWYDLSSGYNHVTLSNVEFRKDDYNGYLHFNGTNSSGSIPTNNTIAEPNGDSNAALENFGRMTGDDSNVWSVEFWVRMQEYVVGGTNGRDGVPLIGRSDGDLYAQTNIHLGRANYVHYNGSWQSLTGNAFVADGSWHQIVFANQGGSGQMNIYVDGHLDVNGDSSMNDGRYFIPSHLAQGYNSKFLDGDLAVVRIYDTTLSAGEVMQNYQAARWRFGS